MHKPHRGELLLHDGPCSALHPAGSRGLLRGGKRLPCQVAGGNSGKPSGSQPLSHLQGLPFVFLTPVSSGPICRCSSIISSPRRSPICLLFLPFLCCSLSFGLRSGDLISLHLSPPLLPLPPRGSLPTSGAPHPPGPEAERPTPPTSFPALKGKNIHVLLTSPGLPEGQTSLCVCLPWSQLRPLSLGTLLVISGLRNILIALCGCGSLSLCLSLRL